MKPRTNLTARSSAKAVSTKTPPYGYNSSVAEAAVRAAISEDTWKPFAITKAEEFFYYLSPKQPSQHDMEQYLAAALGFGFDVANFAIETLDIPTNFVRSEEDVKDWVSLAELEDMLFSVEVGNGTIKLNYGTNQNYYLTGLPGMSAQGQTCYLNFNGESVEWMYFSDGNITKYTEMYYLDLYDLINVGILDSEGSVANRIVNDIPQDPISRDTSTPSLSNNQSVGTGVTVPTESETTGNLVWVPTNGGTKYHSKAGCSNMINPIHVSIETAIANGYTACKRCH